MWDSLVSRYGLTQTQIDKMKRYAELLEEWNRVHNITRITDPEEVVSYHFDDSLRIVPFLNEMTISGMCDIGSGGGFPGMPLALYYPQVPVVLLEVNLKKASFLQKVIQELNLENVTVCTLDWRTFLRVHEQSIGVFVARASLQVPELMRMFKPGCMYNASQLIYWAADTWNPDTFEQPYIWRQESYVVGNRRRKFVFFKKP